MQAETINTTASDSDRDPNNIPVKCQLKLP